MGGMPCTQIGGLKMKLHQVPTPCYVVDETLLRHNLSILKGVADRTGAKILLAQKAFSMYPLYPLISEYLSGSAASGIHEARLGAEEMGKETHVFSAAYRDEEICELMQVADHVVFNSFTQLRRHREVVLAAGKEIGLRINPQCSTQEGHAIYDPCSPYSRLGITREQFDEQDLEGVTGLHFHTLCQQNSDALEETLLAVEAQFGKVLERMKWINFGGGHHITRADYDIPRLERCICHMQEKYGLQVYLEPGEAIALNAGWLYTKVLDLIHNGMDIAILDTSAVCHMPDVLEMPYRPPLKESGYPGEKPFLYRLGGPTCLAGDIIGDYSFDHPLQVGDTLVFEDMAIYTMVKTNTFNGMPLPSLVIQNLDGDCEVIHRFGYEDFKHRLG